MINPVEVFNFQDLKSLARFPREVLGPNSTSRGLTSGRSGDFRVSRMWW